MPIAAGLSLVGTGVAMGVVMAVKRRGGVLSWLIPTVLVALGLALAGTGAATRYGAHVDEAEQRVRDELGQLDPFARVKVLKDLAQEQIPAWMQQGEGAQPS